jgi:hypothetical protein
VQVTAVFPEASPVIVPRVAPEPSFMVSVLDPSWLNVPDIVTQVFDAFLTDAVIAPVRSTPKISLTPLA